MVCDGLVLFGLCFGLMLLIGHNLMFVFVGCCFVCWFLDAFVVG